MPRKKYDDDALRQRALELRSRGLSYGEIACELGCSVFKVYQLISPYESPRSRIKQVLEGPLPRSPPPYRLSHKLPNPLHMPELVV